MFAVLFTIPMIPSPMMISVSSCSRSTRCVNLKLTIRQKIAIAKIARPSRMAMTNLIKSELIAREEGY
jgi:hypothetical protein